jgi:hypothetical protein
LFRLYQSQKQIISVLERTVLVCVSFRSHHLHSPCPSPHQDYAQRLQDTRVELVDPTLAHAECVSRAEHDRLLRQFAQVRKKTKKAKKKT